MIANFCEMCGLRIVKPGKCKACDQVAGVDAHVEPVEVKPSAKPSKNDNPKPAVAPEK
jgi:hypothetical protein